METIVTTLDQLKEMGITNEELNEIKRISEEVRLKNHVEGKVKLEIEWDIFYKLMNVLYSSDDLDCLEARVAIVNQAVGQQNIKCNLCNNENVLKNFRCCNCGEMVE